MKLKLITFDFWSTIYYNKVSLKTNRKEIIKHAFLDAGYSEITEDILDSAISQAYSRWDAVWIEETRTLLVEEWLEYIIDEIGVKISHDKMLSCCHSLQSLIMLDNTTLIKGVREAIKQLKNKYFLAIISDTGIASGKYLTKRLQKDGLDLFDYYLYSDEFGRCKPHTSVFHKVLENFNVSPHDALHIGDIRRTDIKGAIATGMHSIRFSGINDDQDRNFGEAEYVLDDYSKLVGLIDNAELL